MVTPAGHSPIGFSKADRWMNCPGSVEAERGRPNSTNPSAELGTWLHDIAADVLIAIRDSGFELSPEKELGRLCGTEIKGREFDLDHYELLIVYVEYVVRRVKELKAAHGEAELWVEKEFHLTEISDLLWGTSDAVIVAPPVIEAIDLKTGHGVRVPVMKGNRPNPQITGYGVGALQQVDAPIETLIITVSQPPFSKVPSSLTIDVAEELFDLTMELQECVNTALAPGADRHAGAHCKWCLAERDCPEYRRKALSIFDEFEATPEEADGADLAEAYSQLNIIRNWADAIEEEVKRRLKTGKPVPGYKIVAKEGRRAWKADAEDVKAALAMAGLPENEFIKPGKLCGIGDAEKLARRHGVYDEINFDELTTRSAGSEAVVPEDDPRAAAASAAQKGVDMFDAENE